MRRSIALFILLVGLTVTTWAQSDRVRLAPDKTLRFISETMPPDSVLAAHLGPLRLEHAWEMKLGSWLFGGYSALVPLPDGRLLAISDGGKFLAFTPPGGPRYTPRFGTLLPDVKNDKRAVDVESATRDPRTGTLWLGLEMKNSIVRIGHDWMETGRVRPKSMRDWGRNSGPEAMTRLADGRFVLLREAAREWWRPRTHEAVIFSGDPVEDSEAAQRFVFDGPGSFDPVDMVQLPDGRLLVLMRTLVWPFPQRFAGRIAIGDPSGIRPGQTWRVTEVARIASSLPIDNFEAMAVQPRADGKLTIWLMSDDNSAGLQRTLLWKLAVDPADLPSGK